MSTEHVRRSARRVPGTLAVTATVLVALGIPAPAHAAPPSPGEKIANALRKSPVYVDPAYAQAVPPTRQRGLVRQIERTGLPLYVVLVPLIDGDAWDGEADQLAGVVHDRMESGAGEETILITTSDLGAKWLRGHEWPGRKHQARDAAASVGFQDEMKEKSLGAQVSRAIEIVESGDGRKQYEEATADLGERSPRDGSGPPLSLVLSATALALLGGGAFFVRRRRRSSAPTRISSPNLVFASARSADERGLRRRAHDEVVAFGEELSEAEAASGKGAGALQHALDAYAAAGTVLDAARGIPDLAGVLALVSEGRDSLRAVVRAPSAGRLTRRALRLTAKHKQQPALPLCFFHPLHGRAVRRIRWRPLGRRESLLAAACENCSTAVRTYRLPEVLTDRQDGRDVPYFEVPAGNSLWAATGYGSLGEETLTERVIRGDFSRAARSQGAPRTGDDRTRR